MKLFYFTCEPATENKLTLNKYTIDLNGEDIQKIKMNQSDDFYYLYKNKVCEIFYSILKLDENGNYYYDFMIFVTNNFNISKVYNNKFKTIKIVKSRKIYPSDITFEFIKNIFEERVITLNNCIPPHDKDYYSVRNYEYGYDNFVKYFKYGSKKFHIDEYQNFNSFHFYKKFDQERFARSCFRLLCSQVWSSDRIYYIEKNEHGHRITFKEKYNVNSFFLTNFAQIINSLAIYLPINLDDEDLKIKGEIFTNCCIVDTFIDKGMFFISFSEEYLDTNKLDIDNLKIEKLNKY